MDWSLADGHAPPSCPHFWRPRLTGAAAAMQAVGCAAAQLFLPNHPHSLHQGVHAAVPM